LGQLQSTDAYLLSNKFGERGAECVADVGEIDELVGIFRYGFGTHRLLGDAASWVCFCPSLIVHITMSGTVDGGKIIVLRFETTF
jgi:hypothetical protein